MDRRQNQRDAPEGRKIEPALVGKVEKLQRVTTYFAPVGHKDDEGYGKCTQSQKCEPPSENEAELSTQPD